MHEVPTLSTGLGPQERATAFQQLVNRFVAPYGAECGDSSIHRYISQIRFGCCSEQCQYPHCWSCRKRLATSPPRRPTLLTARIQAYALATRRDPYAALCQHELVETIQTHSRIDPVDNDSPPVTKDDFSLVQCLLDSASFTSFENSGSMNNPISTQKVKYAFQEVDGNEIPKAQREGIEHCMQILKRLFIKPPQLCAPDQQPSIQLTEKEKLRILHIAAHTLMYRAGSRPDTADVTGEIQMLLADRLVRAVAAQRCHWEVIHGASKEYKPFLLFSAVIYTFVSDPSEEMLNFIPSTAKTEPLAHWLDPVEAKHIAVHRLYPTFEYFFFGCKSRYPTLPPIRDTASDAKLGSFKAPDTRKVGQSILNRLLILAGKLTGLLRYRWTGAFVVKRCDTIGATLECLRYLHHFWRTCWSCPLDLRYAFRSYLLRDLRNIIRDPHQQDLAISFMNSTDSPNTTHLLSCPLLFEDSALVKHFRTLNYMSMLGSYRQSLFHDIFLNVGPRKIISERGLQYLVENLRAARTHFITLDVRRHNVIEDAFDQLRGREMRELARPLKVVIGRSDAGGEIGIDQGGLTQEFFALAAAEAFNEDFGMFTTDSTSNFSWFRPLSPVPTYKFELLGLLFSLALYNGAIVPVNFPHAMYRLLLGDPLTDPIASISDGWPDLAKSFQYMVDWEEKGPEGENQEIADTLSREYVFSFETPSFPANLPEGYTISGLPTARGSLLEYDLRLQNNWFKTHCNLDPRFPNQGPSTTVGDQSQTPDETHVMVTNANRHHYIRDYVDFLLVDSVAPQYQAFAKGFRTLLKPKALSLLSPPLLQRLVEGDHALNVNELEQVATYEDGYFHGHPVIKHFWSVMRSWPSKKQRKLLEFVTASDRVPVTGLRSVTFSIVRNGAVEELPTSQTCFGRLNLPEYESKEKLERMLDIALEYGQGFGVM